MDLAPVSGATRRDETRGEGEEDGDGGDEGATGRKHVGDGISRAAAAPQIAQRVHVVEGEAEKWAKLASLLKPYKTGKLRAGSRLLIFANTKRLVRRSGRRWDAGCYGRLQDVTGCCRVLRSGMCSSASARSKMHSTGRIALLTRSTR